MLIINNYNNYIFIELNEYCKFNNIIIINIFAYSFHLLQPLNVKLYLFLKFVYNCQINFFIHIFFNHIIKIKFFIANLITQNAIFIKKNIKKGFKSIGISSWDLNFVISKLNVYFYKLIFFSFYSNFNHQWELQILKTEKQIHSQFYLIKDCIFIHQRNFFILILKIVN